MSNKEHLPKTKYTGTISIGGKDLSCAVLDDGTRILTSAAIFKAFGRPRRGNTELRGGANVPSFIDAKNLQPFVQKLGVLDNSHVIEYRSGNRKLTGYKADILPNICDVYLEARMAKVLTPNQLPLAQAAEILSRALSHIGIAALIDEATGYQLDREQEALQKLLSKYLSAERLKWAKMFPDEFYKQLFRLRNWSYDPSSMKRPQYVGKLTNQLVYEKLPPHVLEELKRLNPVKNKKTWRREATHHQYLTEDVGQRDLHDHLMQLITVMRISSDWQTFMKNFSKAFPGDNEQLLLFDDDDLVKK